jgi:hypothetical protein
MHRVLSLRNHLLVADQLYQALKYANRRNEGPFIA